MGPKKIKNVIEDTAASGTAAFSAGLFCFLDPVFRPFQGWN
jgi:hypothetical protein